MNPRRRKSVTLFELLVALILISLLVLGLSSISIFSNYQVRGTDMRLKLQNDLSYILQHMSRKMVKAFGNNISLPAVRTDGIGDGNDPGIRVWVDNNQDGVQDTNPIGYVFRNAQSAQADRFEVWYYSSYTSLNDPHEVLSEKIYDFSATANTAWDYVAVSITACWNPDPNEASPPNGTQDNPCVQMQDRIHLPGVSVK